MVRLTDLLRVIYFFFFTVSYSVSLDFFNLSMIEHYFCINEKYKKSYVKYDLFMRDNFNNLKMVDDLLQLPNNLDIMKYVKIEFSIITIQ